MKKQKEVCAVAQSDTRPLITKSEICGLAAAVIGGISIMTSPAWGPKAYQAWNSNRSVECESCRHLIKKGNAWVKKSYRFAIGSDDKFDNLYFCDEHEPNYKWDYKAGGNFYKYSTDRQVNEDGTESTNKVPSFWITFSSNGCTINTNWYGPASTPAKHLP